MSRNKRYLAAVMSAALLSANISAFAGGYEKANLWSGRWTAVGSAATSAVTESQSLYFNPAGLAAGNNEASLSFSYINAQFEAPITTPNQSVKTDRFTTTPFAALVNYNLTEQLGIGIGYYVVGGSKIEYKGVAFAPTFSSDVMSDIKLFEGSLGVGYEIMDGLRLGAAWRMMNVTANFVIPSARTGLLSSTSATDLKDTKFDGYRLGMQYAPKDSVWGAGITFRSPIKFTAEGKQSTRFLVTAGPGAGTTGTGTETDLKATNELPMQVSLGAFFDVMPTMLRTYWQYDFTRYSVNRSIDLEGTTNLGAAGSGATTDIEQNWKNQHTGRVGFEYMGFGLPARLGYTINSKVTPLDDATPTSTTPGTGHAILIGSGMGFLENALTADLAAEYGWAKADARGNVAGTYKSNGYSAHLTVGYKF